MQRHFSSAALAALLSIFPTGAGAADIGPGAYTSPITGPAELSGTVNLTVSGGADAALVSRSLSAPITGAVRSLTIHAADTDGMVASGGAIRLNGAVNITTTGPSAVGVRVLGPGSSLSLNGPVRVATSGDYSHGLANTDAAAPGGLDISGPLELRTTGTSAFGVYLFGGVIHLGETGIATTGAGSHGVYALGGTLILDGPTTIRVAAPNAYVLLIQGQAPYTDSAVTTRPQPGLPNPQRLDIEGPVRVYGSGNRLELDLAPGSHLNSTLLEADDAGEVSLNFYGHDAQWTTGMGSTIRNGTLNLDFTGGGVWNLPATDASDAAHSAPAPPLLILSAGRFTLRGADSLRVEPSTSLAAGESGTYVLIQSENALPAGLETMRLLSGSLLYRADSLSTAALGGRSTLEATITRLNISQALPDLDPGVGGLLPDGPGPDGSGRPDDGGGNPFLALALAQHLNGLSLDEITSALEGAPALARALPVTSLTRNLEARVRQSSPVGRLYGRGPERQFAVPSERSPYHVWAAPLYLHERESLPRPGTSDARYRADLGGLIVGLGRASGPWTLGGGLSAGGGTSSATGGIQPRTTGRIDYLGGLLYGLWEQHAWSLGLELNILSTWNELRQQNPVMPLRARVRVDGLGLEAVAARRFTWGGWSLTPNAGLEYSHFTQRSYTVRGTLANGRDVDLFDNDTVRQGVWRTPVGVKISRLLAPDGAAGWLVQPEVHARYIPVLGKTRADLPVRRADAPDIRTTLTGTGLDRHTLETGLGVDARRGPLRLALGYNWQHSVRRDAHLLTGTLGWTF